MALLFSVLPALTLADGKARPHTSIFADTSNVPPTDPSGLLEWPPPAPYSHTVKDLGSDAAQSLTACRDACIAYVNTEASPVSGWSRCQSFTYLPSPLGTYPQCVAVVDAGTWAPVALAGATTGRLSWPARACSNHGDCSFNGVCVKSACVCDAAWRGDRCQTLAVKPAKTSFGLRLVDGGVNTSSCQRPALELFTAGFACFGLPHGSTGPCVRQGVAPCCATLRAASSICGPP